MDYRKEVERFIKSNPDPIIKNQLIEAYEFLQHGFARELALATRDYDLGLTDILPKRKVQLQAYHAENTVRYILGLPKLPQINESLL